MKRFDSETHMDDAASVNNTLIKEINRFLIMCIEQYASSTNKSGKHTYEIMDKGGVLQELIDDYEDMHGMPAQLINDYIDKRLNEAKI